jgi:hypothetical protein
VQYWKEKESIGRQEISVPSRAVERYLRCKKRTVFPDVSRIETTGRHWKSSAESRALVRAEADGFTEENPTRAYGESCVKPGSKVSTFPDEHQETSDKSSFKTFGKSQRISAFRAKIPTSTANL